MLINHWAGTQLKIAVTIFVLSSIIGVFLFGNSAQALDPSLCAKVYGEHYNSCKLFTKGDFENACQKANGSFQTKLEEAGKGSAPACNEMFFLYYTFVNGTLDKPLTDLMQCIKELANCAESFLSCQGNTGVIDTNNLEGQCNFFLEGGKKSWSQLVGNNLCTEAMKSDGSIGQKCTAYQESLEKAKAGEGLVPVKDTSVEEYKQALAEMQDKASGLNKLGTTDIKVVIGRVIKAGMGVMGSLALVMFIYGGILWMISRGESDKAEKALQILVWSTLGVVVIFSSYALLDIVFEVFR